MKQLVNLKNLTLILYLNNLNDVDLKYLGEGVKFLHNLEGLYLDLSNNSLGEGGYGTVKNLGNIMKQLGNIKKL